jgi:hypothetical protein
VPLKTPVNGVVTNVSPVVAPNVSLIEVPPETADRENVDVPLVAEM